MARRVTLWLPLLVMISEAASAQLPTTAPPAALIETVSIPGLTAPGDIVVDHWGIAHIYAGNDHDAFFLQGYNAARDRLWQIDLWRKRGLGRLSASFGPAFVAKDRAARLLLYRGDMAAEWASYPGEARGWTEAFVAGINAYVDAVEQGRLPLPREFTLTGSRPEQWVADDVIRIRSNALVSNLANEVVRARSVCRGGLPFETLRRRLEPAHRIVVPRGLDACDVPDDVLTDYLLGTQEVAFDGKKVAALPGPTRLTELAGTDVLEGSNNWVVAADHSATGRPILANDPHREHSVPSLRYIVDVSAPGLHFAGAGEPALPGVSFGHNDRAAWGLTIFYADQQDLYVYKISPDHPGRYFYKGAWVPFETVKERIPVKGGPDQEVELLFTRHGAVIHQDATKARAFALRSIWSAPGGAGYFNAAWMLRAGAWADFETTHARWGAPPLNLIYADVSGDIGWRASAFVPLRRNWDGLMPVPGDGRFEWQGFVPPDQLPMLRNPQRGWIATANEMNVPASYPTARQPIGFEWVDRSRIDQIETRLAAKDKLDLVDMMSIQTDTHSPLARRTAALLDGLTGEGQDEKAALALLHGWDADERADSPQAALFETWATSYLRPAVIKAVVPAMLAPVFRDAQAAAVVDWLERTDPALGKDPAAARRFLLLSSLAAAWKECVKTLGPDPARWRWGSLHRAEWTESVAALASPADRPQFRVGPLGVGGSNSTPMATSYRAGDFGVTAGASVRMVLDVGAWDNSMIVNMPGQSGDAMSPHYRDLFVQWAGGDYVPMLYSKEAVMPQAERVIRLAPAK